MVKHKILHKWRILFAQVSFEKGVHIPCTCARIYWCTGKLLIINMDGCPELLNGIPEPDVNTRCNVSGLMLLLTPKWNRVSPSLRAGPDCRVLELTLYLCTFKSLLNVSFMFYDGVKWTVKTKSWFCHDFRFGFGLVLWWLFVCLFFSLLQA